MFCPQCGDEYQDGVVTCADCDVPLVVEDPRAVSEEPDLQPRGDWRFEPLVRTTNPAEIAAITSAFDAGQIHYYVYDQHTSSGMRSLAIEARIVVRSDQVELAQSILEGVLATDADARGDRDVASTARPQRDFSAPAAPVSTTRATSSGPGGSTSSGAADDALSCPDCGAALEADDSAGVVQHTCTSCRGSWLDAAEFGLYAESLARQVTGARFPELVYAQPEEVAPCPACRQLTLRWGSLADITVAHCQRCEGIFLANDPD